MFRPRRVPYTLSDNRIMQNDLTFSRCHPGKFITRFHVHEKVKIRIHADVKWVYMTKNRESRKNKILNHASRKKYLGRGPSPRTTCNLSSSTTDLSSLKSLYWKVRTSLHLVPSCLSPFLITTKFLI